MPKGLKIFLIVLLVIFSIGASVFIYVYQNIDQLKKYAITEVNTFLKAELTAENIDVKIWNTFPKVSLALNEVRLSDPLQSNHSLLLAKHVYLGFDVYDILKENYRINFIELDSGTIQLYSDAAGRSNFDIIKDNTSEPNTKKPFSFELKKLSLLRMQVSFTNAANGFKVNSYLNEANFSGKFSDEKFNLSIALDGLAKEVNTGALAIIQDKSISMETELAVNQIQQKYELIKGDFKLNKLVLALTGWVQTGKKQDQINLEFKAKTLSIQDLLSTLPIQMPASIKEYQSKGDVFFEGSVIGISSPTKKPKIALNFGVNNGSLLEPTTKMQLQNISLKGSFSNGSSGRMEEARFDIPNFSASLPGSQIAGSLSVNNLQNPLVALQLNGNADLASLNAFFHWEDVSSLLGSASFGLNLTGQKTNDTWNWKSAENTGNVSMQISELKVSYLTKPLQNMKVDVLVKGGDLQLNQLKLTIDKSDMAITGNIPRFMDIFFQENNLVQANLQLQSNYLNIAHLLIYDSSDPREANEKPINYLIQAKVFANQLVYEKFVATQCKGNLTCKPNYISFQETSLQTAKGSFAGSGEFFESDKQFILNSKSDCKGIDLGELLLAFDNFGQQEVTHKNLFGSLSASAEYRIVWDQNMNFLPEKLVMIAEMSLKNGSLVQYQPLQSLSKFIDVNELNNIKFSELKNTFTIKNKLLTIPAMDIKSNACNLQIAGNHSFENILDYRLKVSLSELLAKKRKAKPSEFDEEDTKTRGINLYLSIKGPANKLKFEFDKRGAKEQLKQDIKVEKELIKEILKQELGIKKDSSLKKLEKKNENYNELEFEEN